MKSLLSLLAISLLCLLIIFTGCGSPATISPYPANIPVEKEPCENDPEGKIIIDNVTVKSGTLDRDYYTPEAGNFPAGSPCFLVSVHINNGYNEDCWVTFSAHGLDKSGNQVSFTLDSGPSPGAWQVYLASFSSAEYTLHLSWADNVNRMIIPSQRTTRAVPSPSPTASST